MKVRCLARQLDEKQRAKLRISPDYDPWLEITPGREYTVLALSFVAGSEMYGAGPAIDVRDDLGRCATAPLALFEITDHRPSQHWVIRKFHLSNLMLWPQSFYQHAYHDFLSDYVPEYVEDFERVADLLEHEFDLPQAIQAPERDK